MHTKASPTCSPQGAAVHPGPVGPFGGHTRQALHWIVLIGVAMVAVGGPAGLTRDSDGEWVALICLGLALWVAWLYWRTAEGDCDVPVHVLHPFLAVPIVILLAHLLKQATVDSTNGVALVISGDTSMLVRLMTLALLVLLVQDVLSRVGHLRWLLTALGATMALGAILHSAVAARVPVGLVLIGFAGVGVLTTPLVVPALSRPAHRVLEHVWVSHADVTARISLAALLSAALTVISPVSAALACSAVAGSVLLAGVFLKHHRWRLLSMGAMLAVGGAVGMYRLEVAVPEWLGGLSWMGSGGRHGASVPPSASGLWMLGSSAGWVGAAALCAGMLAAPVWSLYACRRAAPGDQARAALWACVVVLSGLALLAEGGLSVPAIALAAAVTFGLMPHLMAHRVPAVHGWVVAVAFAAVLVVLGMERRLGGTMWLDLARRHGDATMHFFGAMVLTVVLFWQTRSHRLWQALLCGLAGATLAAGGEIAQTYLTSVRRPEWSDVVADVLGAGAALGIFLVIRAVAWVELSWTQRPTKVSFEKYRQ